MLVILFFLIFKIELLSVCSVYSAMIGEQRQVMSRVTGVSPTNVANVNEPYG